MSAELARVHEPATPSGTDSGPEVKTRQRWNSVRAFFRWFRSWWCRHSRIAICAIAYVVYAGYSLSRFTQLRVRGYDLGIFDQVVRNYAHFQLPIVSLKGDGYNIWGDHFHPILMVLAPTYWIWDDPRVLLAAQAGLISVSIWVIHRYLERHFGRLTADLGAVAYGLGWPIQTMADFDFHEVAFALPLLALAIDAWDRRDDRSLILSCLALLLVREDMGLVVLLLGIVRVARRPRWPALMLMMVGPLAYVAVTGYVLPYFAPNGKFAYWEYTALGPDLPHALVFIATHPLSALSIFFTPTVKVITLAALFLPVALLAFRSPLVILALPLLAERFLSPRENLWQIKFHYSAVIWPIIFLAAVDGAVRLGLINKRRIWATVRVFFVAVPLVGTLVGVVGFPLHRVVNGEAFTASPFTADRLEILDAIPAGTCVEADDQLTVHLTRTNLVSIPGLLGRPPDCIVVDRLHKGVGGNPPAPRTVVVLAQAEALGYQRIESSGPLLLLQRPGYAGPSPQCEPA